MAQTKRSISFKNAVINMNDNTITEYTKDDTKTYNLLEILHGWNAVEGISFSIQLTEDMPCLEDVAGDAITEAD